MTKQFFTSDDCDYHPDTICYISVDRANALIRERGKVVYGAPEEFCGGFLHPFCPLRGEHGYDTHQALLICIEPIEADTAEKVLKDFLLWCDSTGVNTEAMLVERAKRLLEKK